MVTLNIPEEEFKLLLTLCAHDFRHDFMNTSDRVHAGILKGTDILGGGNAKIEENEITIMGVYLNDIIFLKNLKEQNIKSKSGAEKLSAVITAMNNTNTEFEYMIKVLKILNLVSEPTKKTRRNKFTPLASNTVEPLAIRGRLRHRASQISKAVKKTKRKKGNPKKNKPKKTKKKKPKKHGGANGFDGIGAFDGIGTMDPTEMGTGFDVVIPDDYEFYIDSGEGIDLGYYEIEEDYDNNKILMDYIAGLNPIDELTAEYIEEITAIKEETVDKVEDEVTVNKAVRRSGRSRATQYYGELVDEKIYEDWNNKYEIYSEIYPVDTFNRVLIDDATLKIKQLDDFEDLKEFTVYYKNIAAVTEKTSINFNGFIQYLNGKYDGIELAISRKVSGKSMKVIKEFGKKVSKVWYNFIVGETPRAVSPTLTPPTRPGEPLTAEGKLLAKMYHSTNAATSTDATVFSLFKNYFDKKYPGEFNNVRPVWHTSDEIINNASQLSKHSDLFTHPEKCYAPSVLDAMSNCPSKNLHDTEDINIKVKSGENYIHYKVSTIKDKDCKMEFKFKNGSSVIETKSEILVYSNKDLSVVNVLKKLFETVNNQINGLSGGDTDKKIEIFGKLMNNDNIHSLILPIFCMKLFGDLGQELLAVANGRVLASNDRPSAIRYMLMKLSADVVPEGGGGYFPNDKANRFYV